MKMSASVGRTPASAQVKIRASCHLRVGKHRAGCCDQEAADQQADNQAGLPGLVAHGAKNDHDESKGAHKFGKKRAAVPGLPAEMATHWKEVVADEHGVAGDGAEQAAGNLGQDVVTGRLTWPSSRPPASPRSQPG